MVYFALHREKATENNGQFQKLVLGLRWVGSALLMILAIVKKL
jgi:hypothetical protein